MVVKQILTAPARTPPLGQGHSAIYHRGVAPNLQEAQRLKHVRVIVMTVFKVSEQQLDNRQRGKAQIAFARQVAMYLAHIACGLSLTEVGRCFGRDRTTVAHACRLVEDWREDPNLDLSLDLIEGALLRLWSLAEGGGQ